MAQTIMTAEHAIRAAYDPATESLKTTPSGVTSFAVQLNQADGDSVTSYSVKGTATVASGDIIDCKEYNAISVYVIGTATVTIDLSPVDTGSVFVNALAATATTNAQQKLTDVVARRVKITYTGTPTAVYFVGRN